jgi:hypothetical protein
MRVQLEVDDAGGVEARRSSGERLGDAFGDACLEDVFATSRVLDPELHGSSLAEIPLVFYLHSATQSAPRSRGGKRSISNERRRMRTETASYNEASAAAGQRRPGPWSPR